MLFAFLYESIHVISKTCMLIDIFSCCRRFCWSEFSFIYTSKKWSYHLGNWYPRSFSCRVLHTKSWYYTRKQIIQWKTKTQVSPVLSQEFLVCYCWLHFNFFTQIFLSHFDRFRQYGLWTRYTDLYPDNDLIYTIGVSDYSKDWFYAQVTRYFDPF